MCLPRILFRAFFCVVLPRGKSLVTIRLPKIDFKKQTMLELGDSLLFVVVHCSILHVFNNSLESIKIYA